LPDFPDVGHVVTPRHLIHHVSGLREQYELLVLAGRDLRDLVTQPQLIKVFEQQRALNFAPGTDFLYGNSGYTLLAEVVQAVSGHSLREFTTQRMFEPLGMKRTFYIDDWREVVPGRAAHYEKSEGRWLHLRDGAGDVGAVGLLTTVEDLAQWAGNFGKPRVGDAALIDLISRSGRLNDGSSVHYGFGLFDQPQRGRKAISHLGVDRTVMSFLVYYPEHDLGIAVLSNSDVEVTEVALDIADLYLPPVKSTVAQQISPPVVAKPAQLARLVGTYVSEGLPALLLESDTAGLKMRLTGDQDGRALVLRRDGTFDSGSPASEYFRPTATGVDRIRAVGAPTHYRRVERVQDERSRLAKLAGRYHSDELDVTYEFAVEGDQLVARSLWRAEPIRLVQITAEQFDSDAATLRRNINPHSFTFDIDASGRAARVRMHSARARNIELLAVKSTHP
ncbi:serine hydrolase domain-containing protein, partial [Steroidobacter sp.]|uniref:serine hydrolase domain-containing protein n=1 Tax=Steroidobacter sp. TaxID=1978227 RepID=UPI001A57B0CF